MPSLDRTFTHHDVIRIYDKHLSENERLLVQQFFNTGSGEGLFTSFELEALSRTDDDIFGTFSTLDIIDVIIINVIDILDEIIAAQRLRELETLRSDLDEMEQFMENIGNQIPSSLNFLWSFFTGGVIRIFDVLRLLIAPLLVFVDMRDGLVQVRTMISNMKSNAAIWADKV